MTWPNHVPGFDAERFLAAVHAYRERWNLSRSELVRVAGFDLSTGMRMMSGGAPPSLRFVCAMADICDLSIDTYRTADTLAVVS